MSNVLYCGCQTKSKKVDVLKANHENLFNNVHIFEAMKSHIYEPNITQMINNAKPWISNDSKHNL